MREPVQLDVQDTLTRCAAWVGRQSKGHAGRWRCKSEMLSCGGVAYAPYLPCSRPSPPLTTLPSACASSLSPRSLPVPSPLLSHSYPPPPTLPLCFSHTASIPALDTPHCFPFLCPASPPRPSPLSAPLPTAPASPALPPLYCTAATLPASPWTTSVLIRR